MSVDTVAPTDERADAQAPPIDVVTLRETTDALRVVLVERGVPRAMAHAALTDLASDYAPLASHGDKAGGYDKTTAEGKARASEIKGSTEVDRTAYMAARARYATFWSAAPDQREAARLGYVAAQTEAEARLIEAALRRPGISGGRAAELQQELVTARRHAAAARRGAARAAWDHQRRQSRIVMVDADRTEAERRERATARSEHDAATRLATMLEHPQRDGLAVLELCIEADAAEHSLTSAEGEAKRLELISKAAPQEAPHVRRFHHLRIGRVVLFVWGLRRTLKPDEASFARANRYTAMEAKFDRLAQDGELPRLPAYARFFFNPPEAPAEKPMSTVRYAYNVAKGAVTRAVRRLPRRRPQPQAA